MASGQNYPSPTQQQMTSGYGPFYGLHQNGAQSPLPQEVPDDLQLRAELSRSLAPILNHPPLPPQEHDQQAPPPPQQQQQQQHYDDGQQDHSQLRQDLLAFQGRQVSPVDQQAQDAGSKDKPRSKVSRACDECRRKKARRALLRTASHAIADKGQIRCDAPDETGRTACSSCKRIAVQCLFSRQPMKRGPTKGYIKELTERLNALEQGQITAHNGPAQNNAEWQNVHQALTLAEANQRDAEVQPFTSPQDPQTRKRTHDQSEGFVEQSIFTPRPPPYGNAYSETPRQSPYPAPHVQPSSETRSHTVIPSQPQPQHQPQPQSQSQTHSQLQPQLHPQTHPQTHPQPQPQPQQYHQPYSQSQSQLYPQPASALQPFFKYGGDTGRRESVSIPLSHEPEAGIATLIEWDEEVIDEYYRIIHQTFPLLPHSKHRLRQRLAECPTSLREAFLTALECTMRTFPSSNLRANHTYAPAIKRAAELLAGYPFENPSTHTSGTNLVYLQTLLLMALESDNHGPATVRGQAGPSRAEWLGRAAGVAGQLEINLIRPRARFVTEGDPDSEERLSRRVWWVLFVLDRWHASSTADLLKLPENSVVLLPEDQILLGESTYHLARLSFIIGHLAAILTTTKTPETNVMAPTNPASQLLGLTLAGEIDRFRESVESVWGSLNLVHLSYHHCHLLIKRLNPTTEPTELIGHAVKVATVLNQRQTPITPLNHHFAALSAMTLCELVDIDKTRAEAGRGIEQLAEALGLGRGLAGHPEHSSGWDSAIRDLILQKKARLQQAAGGGGEGALNHLGYGDGSGTATPLSIADGNVAATAGGVENGRPSKFDPTMLTRYGYLTALGQGMFVAK